MVYMKFLSLAMGLVNAASDGELTLDEIAACMADSFPEYTTDVAAEVSAAMEDGVITVWEVIKILTTVIG